MFKPLFKTLVAVLAIAAAAAGPAWGQNANPDVTLDFTTNDWGLPAGKTNITYAANSYTSGDYTITLQGGGSSSNGYYFHNDGYLLLGKSGSYLELPEFESAVDSIVVVGKSGASTAVEQNIYVGGTAVSTQTTGATGTNTYVINANYQAAGNIYTLKVESAQNTQITYIKVYYVSSGGGSTPAVPHTVRFASGNDGWTVTDVDSARSATAPAVLQNVMAGDSLVVTAPATLPGKVKSVKAVKYVPPEVITWNSTNVFNSDHQNEELDQQSNPLTYEGITISMSGPDDSYFRAYDHVRQTGSLVCYGQYGDSFTFEAPSGKKFCKIEIINDEWSISFNQYGDWTQPEDNKVVWSGTAANAVTLGTVFTSASSLNSIVFKLIDAQ